MFSSYSFHFCIKASVLFIYRRAVNVKPVSHSSSQPHSHLFNPGWVMTHRPGWEDFTALINTTSLSGLDVCVWVFKTAVSKHTATYTNIVSAVRWPRLKPNRVVIFAPRRWQWECCLHPIHHCCCYFCCVFTSACAGVCDRSHSIRRCTNH